MTDYTPRTAIDAAKWRPGGPVHGCRARYVPNRQPDVYETYPVSDHWVVRLEAWAVVMDDASLAEVLGALTALPGVIDSGTVRENPDRINPRRPYAWVTLPGDGSWCGHSVERWSKP